MRSEDNEQIYVGKRRYDELDEVLKFFHKNMRELFEQISKP